MNDEPPTNESTAKEPRTVKIGDVVALKSGSHKMCVEEVDGSYVHVVYAVYATSMIHREKLLLNTLVYSK